MGTRIGRVPGHTDSTPPRENRDAHLESKSIHPDFVAHGDAKDPEVVRRWYESDILIQRRKHDRDWPRGYIVE